MTGSVGHESDWSYATPTGTLQADQVNQFLSLHEITVVPQGTPVVTVTGALSAWQPLGEIEEGPEGAIIDVGNDPNAICVNATTNTVYVSNWSDQTVSVIDASTNAVTDTIDLTSYAPYAGRGVCVDATTNVLYCVGQDSIVYVDASTNTVLMTVPVPASSHFDFGCWIDESTNTLYATVAADSGDYLLYSFDGTSGSEIGSCELNSESDLTIGVAGDPTTHNVFVGGGLLGLLYIVDGSTMTLTTTVPDLAPAGSLRAVAFDATNSLVYVLDNTDNVVNGVDESGTVVVTSPAVSLSDGLSGLAVNPTGPVLCMSDGLNNQAVYLSGADLDFLGNVPVQEGPSAVAFNSATGLFYVANEDANTVSVISLPSPAPSTYGYAVDQPFVAPAQVGWFRIPVTSTNLAPSTQPGWSGAVPVTVGLYDDDDGLPGTLVATTLVPAEQVESVQLAAWPEPDDLLFAAATVDAQASLPQLPGTGWGGITTLVAGSWGVLFATQGESDTSMWVVPYNGVNLGGWIDGSTLPVSGLQQAVYGPNAGVVVICSDGALYAATFAQTGVVGSWQALAAPSGIAGGLLGIVSSDGQDYLVAVALSGATYYAALSSSGSISGWTAGPAFPVVFSTGNGYQVGDDLVFIVQSGSLSTLVSLSEPGGGWSITGTLNAAAAAVLGVIGTSVVTTNGSQIDATALTPAGTSPWSLPVPLALSGGSVALLAFPTGTGYAAFWIPVTEALAGYQQLVYVPSWVDVPLPQSLTEGDTYHLVLTGPTELTVGTAVPVVIPTSGPQGFTWNNDQWEPLEGAVPFLALYAASGYPLALVSPGKTTVLWFDTPSGLLTTTVELVGQTSQSRILSYTDGVLAEVA